MSTREKILEAIGANKPTAAALPDINFSELIQFPDLMAQFKAVVESIGGVVEQIADINLLQEEIALKQSTGEWVVNRIAALGRVDDSLDSATAASLEQLDVAYLQGGVAVAENGAVWISEAHMGNRLLPFICQHLVLLAEAKNIVPTMHHAYEQVNTAEHGFGVFLAGPSKTADIEQSLVIGAHGARSLRVYILG